MNTSNTSISLKNTGRLRKIHKLYARYSKWTSKLSFAFLDQALFSGTNFIINVLLARWMIPDQYGAFVIAYSWLLLPQNFYEALLIDPLTYFGPSKYSKIFRSYMGYVFFGHIFIGGLVAIMLGLGAIATYVFDSTLMGTALAGATVTAPLFLTRYLTRRPFYVLSTPQWSALGGAIYLVVTVVGVSLLHLMDLGTAEICLPSANVIPCITFSQEQWLNPFSALVIMGIAAFIASIILTIFFLKPKFNIKEESLTVKDVVTDHWEYGKWSLGSRFLRWLPVNSYFLLLPLFGGLSDSGALRALANLTMPLHMSITTLGAVLLPNFVRTYTKHGRGSLHYRTRVISRVLLLITGTYMIVIVVFGKSIVNLLYDGAFNDIVTIPILLAIGLTPVVSVTGKIINTALNASGHIKRVFLSRILPTVFTMTIGVFLLANYGILGASLSSLLSATISLIILGYYYRLYVVAEEPKTEPSE